MDGIKNESDALRDCSDKFVSDARSEYDLDIHHIEVTSRKNSCISVDTDNGKGRLVPVLDIYFMDDSFQKLVDERKRLKTDVSDKLRKLWQETTILFREYLNKQEYCDPQMYIHASDFEQKCFYDFITNKQTEITELLKNRLGVLPERLYTALEGINIVYTTADYTALELETRADGLREEICALADRYIVEKYRQSIMNVSYVRFLHPEMPGYNGYGLWLG